MKVNLFLAGVSGAEASSIVEGGFGQKKRFLEEEEKEKQEQREDDPDSKRHRME